MTTDQHRLPGEGAAQPEKDNATAGNRGVGAAKQATDAADSIRETSRETERERGLFLPLLWAELAREVKPAKFRGKGKRQARAAAINAKRNQGAVDPELVGLLALAAVAGAMLMGVV
ncbi:hypothetical protein ACUH78_01850 [Thauera sp. ZXT1-4]|uniref:hypothetical protein n=1 Tax=Thauera sp. ZXT1-4 TaxID=3460294 RepID=UPI004040BC67